MSLYDEIKKKEKNNPVQTDSGSTDSGLYSFIKNNVPKQQVERINTSIVSGRQQQAVEEKKVYGLTEDRIDHSFVDKTKSIALQFGGSIERGLSNVGTTIRVMGEDDVRKQKENERILAEGKGISGIQYTSPIAKEIVSAGKKIEGYFGGAAENTFKNPNYIKELGTITDEQGNVDVSKLLDPANFLQATAGGLASMIPTFAAVVITRGKNIPILLRTGIPMATGFVLEKGNAYNDFENDMAEFNNVKKEDLTDEQKNLANLGANVYGIIAGKLETLFPDSVVSKIGKKGVRTFIRRFVTGGIIDAMKGGAREGLLNEAPQQLAQNLIEKFSGINPNQSISEGVLDSAYGGFAAGSTTGYAFSALDNGVSVQDTSSVPPAPMAPVQQGTVPPDDGVGGSGTQTPNAPVNPATGQNLSENEVALVQALADDDKKSVKKYAERASTEELANVEKVFDHIARQGDVVEAEQARQMIQDIRENRDERVQDAAQSIVDGESVENATAELPAEDKKKVIDFVEKASASDEAGDNVKTQAETVAKLREEQSKLDEQKKTLLDKKAKTEDTTEKKSIQQEINAIDEQRKPEYSKNTETTKDQSYGKQDSSGTQVSRKGSEDVSDSAQVGEDGGSGVVARKPERSVGKESREHGADRGVSGKGNDNGQFVEKKVRFSNEKPPVTVTPRLEGEILGHKVFVAPGVDGNLVVYENSTGLMLPTTIKSYKNPKRVLEESKKNLIERAGSEQKLNEAIEEALKKHDKLNDVETEEKKPLNPDTGKPYAKGDVAYIGNGKGKITSTSQNGENFSIKVKGNEYTVGFRDLEKGREKHLGKNPTKKEIEEKVESKETFTEEEKKEISKYEGAGAKRDSGRGILDEFFTPESVVQKVWDIITPLLPVKSNGLKILEPAAGTGRFLKGAPKGASFVAFEINPTSAKIIKSVYPDANVQNTSFETFFIDEKGNKKSFEPVYDVVVGNPPYGTHRGRYKGIGEEPSIGRYEDYFLRRSLQVTKEGGIVAMVLPSTFLRSGLYNAKTKIAITGDLVAAYRLPNKSFKGTDVGTDIVIFRKHDYVSDKSGGRGDASVLVDDNYFSAFPDHILGTPGTRMGRFGEEYNVEGTLDDAIARMEELITNESDPARTEAVEEEQNFPGKSTPDKKTLSVGEGVQYHGRDGKVLTGTIRSIDEKTVSVSVDQIATMGGVPIGRIETVSKERISPYDYEKANEQEQVVEEVKAKAKKTKKESRTKDQEEKDDKGLMVRDAKRPYLLKSVKKDKTTVFSQTHEPSENELAVFANTLEDGSVDTEKVSKSDLNYLGGKYYGDFNYYQGDIYEKLEQLESDKESMSEQQYEKQKKGLESVLPKPMTIDEITLLPNDRFAREMKIGESTLANEFKRWLRSLPYEAMEGASRYDVIGYVDGSVVNSGDKIRNTEIRKKRRYVGNKLFKKYYRTEIDSETKEKIVYGFNRSLNGTHRPDYKQYPIFPELNKTFYGKELRLREIQMEGAAFLTNKGVGLLAYDVGVGKTLAAISAIAEVMQRGWTKRPLIVVPKNLKTKWIMDIMHAIPGAKINDLSNLGGAFKGDGSITIDEGTISIITEDGFKRIGYSEETFDALTKDLEDTMFSLGEKSKREVEQERSKAQEMAGKASKKTDFAKTFEELGFDHITFDEVHREKNVFAKAQAKGKSDKRSSNEYQALKGSVSERGLKAYLATQYILGKNNGRNVFLLTATPFTNSPIEIYSVMSLMAKKRLEQLGIKNVNEFIAKFIDIESKFAIKADGSVVSVDQTRNFHNLQQLQKLITEYIDFRTGEEAGIPRPDKYQRTPNLKLSELQAKYIQEAQALFNDKSAGVLSAITELQKITMSPYLSRYNVGGVYSVSAKEFVENSPKIRYVVEAIKLAHKKDRNAGQIIFAEKGIESFRVIRDYFINEAGYSSDEVSILDSSVKEAVKDEIQENFQNGKIRILMASGTVKEGIDLQRKSTDLYNIFLPWNPTDMLQIEGRTWRQGSEYKNVRIHYPLVENTIDSFMFQKLEEKAERLRNVWSYKGNTIDVSDIDFEKMKFELITDPTKRLEAEFEFKSAEYKNKKEIAEADLAFLERKTENVEKTRREYEEAKKYQMYDNMNDHAIRYWTERAASSKKKLEESIASAAKSGLNMEEISKKIEEKKSEIEAFTKLISDLRTEFTEKKNAVANEVFKIITGDNDYDSILSDIGDDKYYEKYDQKSYDITDSTVEEILGENESRQMVEAFYRELNPNIQALVEFDVFTKILDKELAKEKIYTRGFFDGKNKVSVARNLSRTQFVRTLMHETRHLAFNLMSQAEKAKVISWYKSLDETDLVSIYGSEKLLNKYRENYGNNDLRMSDETMNKAFDKQEFFDDVADASKIVGRIIRFIRESLMKIHRIISKQARATHKKWLEAESLYNDVFSDTGGNTFKKVDSYKISLKENGFSAGSVNMLGIGYFNEGDSASFEIDDNRHQKSGDLKLNERRAAYAAAIKSVYGDNLPPSLSKIVDENFKETERRTNIAASKMELIGIKTFQTGFSEGKKVGYLSGERAAIQKNEKEIMNLNEKIQNEEYKNEEQKAIFEKELSDKSEKNRELKREMRRKITMQAERHRKAKAALKQKLKDTMTEYKSVRSEMVEYIKENLSSKSYGKFLSAVRDGKTKKNLAKVMEKVDEEIIRVQRAEAVASIKNIMKHADSLPIEFQYKVLKLTEGIQWTGVLGSTIEKLKKIRDYMKSTPDAETKMPRKILERIGILEKKSYKKLTVEQLMNLNVELEQIKEIGIAVRQQRKINKLTSINDILDLLKNTSNNYDIIKQSGMTADEREQMKYLDVALDKLQSGFWGIIPVDAFFKKLDGKDEGTNYQVFKRPLDEAFSAYLKASMEVKKRLQKFIEDNAFDLIDKNYERIGIYAIREQKGGYQKLISSGYTEEQIDGVTLSREEMAMYSFMRRELDALYPLIKKVYEKTQNVPLGKIPNYFPYMMDWENAKPLYREMEDQFLGIKGGVKNKGFTITRVGGSNPVKINALEAFTKHIDQATYFVNMEESVDRARTIAKSSRYGKAVGEKAQKYVIDWVEMMERHGTPENEKSNAGIRALNTLRNNVSLGVLAFKLTTAPIQLGAIFNGAAEIGTSALKGFVDVSSSQELREFVRSSSMEIANRVGDDPSFSDLRPPKAILGIDINGKKITSEQFRKIGLWGIVKMDMLAASGTWIGAYRNSLESRGIEFSLENVDNEAVTYADRIVRKTQATSNFKDIPQALRYSMGKAIFQFQSFLLFQGSYIVNEVAPNVKNDPSKAAWQATFITLNAMWAMTVRDLISRGIFGNGGDDDESFIAKLLWELSQMLPVIGGLVFYAAEKALKGGYYGAGDLGSGIPIIDTIESAREATAKAFVAKTSKSMDNSVVEAVTSAGTLLGVPGAGQMGQAYRAILNNL